jgi:hypothetical protein
VEGQVLEAHIPGSQDQRCAGTPGVPRIQPQGPTFTIDGEADADRAGSRNWASNSPKSNGFEPSAPLSGRRVDRVARREHQHRATDPRRIRCRPPVHRAGAPHRG